MPYTILLVENDRAASFVLQHHFRGKTWNNEPVVINAVSSRGEALNMLTRLSVQSIHTIILDRDISPNTDIAGVHSTLNRAHDGLNLTNIFCNSPAIVPDAPIIVWSARDDDQSIAEAQQAGADAFISKLRQKVHSPADDVFSVLEQLYAADRQKRRRPWIVLV